VRAAKIFVAVMGASNYTFAQARFSEALPDWIGAHVDTLAFLGGVPRLAWPRGHDGGTVMGGEVLVGPVDGPARNGLPP
jgi:transposase